MKNYLTLVLALAVVSSPAYASRARLEALGQSDNGSYFVDDSRDMFLNPAEVANYKKKLFLEYGATTYTTGPDALGNSQAQGGFTNTFGDYTYGVYLGRESDRVLNLLKLANGLTAAGTFIVPDHTIDVFFAGEGAVKWGLDVYYGGSENKLTSNANTSASATVTNTASIAAVKAGVIADKLSVFTTVGVAEDSKNVNSAGTNELKGKFSMDLAATYALDNSMKAKANFSTFGTDLTQLGTQTVDYTGTLFGVGFGYKKEVAKSVTMYSIIGVDYEKDSTTYAGTGGAAATALQTAGTNLAQKWLNVPLSLAAEAQATSWLTLRGAISHSLWGQHTTGVGTDSIDGTNTVAGGVGMTFGDVQIDGVIGTGAAASSGIGYISPKTPQSGDTFGFGNNMLSRLAVTYNF